MKFLTSRQKILLQVIGCLSKEGRCSRTAIEKTLFLLKEESGIAESAKFYSFFPYRFGPFSNVSYADMGTLKAEGYISPDEKSLTEKGRQAAAGRAETEESINALLGRFKSDRQMVDYAYKKYPQYAVLSELTAPHPKTSNSGMYTIGYEGEDIDSFLNILVQNNIGLLADVRYNPFSMKFSFTKNKLKGYLEKCGIGYMHLPQLGIRGEFRKNLGTKESYDRLFRQYAQTTLKECSKLTGELAERSKECRIALMCFEDDPELCHRGVIAAELEKKGIAVTHL